MSIDKDKIKHISKLARISVDAKKTDSLAKDLSSIFKFIEQLNELNTDKTEPLSSILNEPLRFREDVVVKKTKFDLKKAEERAHILIGLSVSVENLDKIIKIIRASKNPEDAKKTIIKLETDLH